MFMLVDSTFKVISHSDIESAGVAGDDVNIVRWHRGILNNEKESAIEIAGILNRPFGKAQGNTKTYQIPPLGLQPRSG